MDTAQWPQEIGVVKSMDGSTRPLVGNQRKARPQRDEAVNCPRCNSTNTKFCYYNNYSLSQPRYFCKTCRRYWTQGGSLRNVPFGGGSRKNKRLSTSSSTSSTVPSFLNSASQNPKIHQGQDLNLAYPSSNIDHHHNLSKFIELPPNPSSSTSHSSHFSDMELLKSDHNIMTSRGLSSSSFMPVAVSDNSNTIYSPSGFPMQDFKPTLNFSLDGYENGYGSSLQGGQQNGGSGSSARLLFPFGELKQVSTSTTDFDHNRSGNADSNGYWMNGMLGGGSW